jgi:hypothetical protein
LVKLLDGCPDAFRVHPLVDPRLARSLQKHEAHAVGGALLVALDGIQNGIRVDA